MSRSRHHRDARLCLLICGLVLLCSCAAPRVGVGSSNENGASSVVGLVDRVVSAFVTDKGIPGLSIAIVNDGETVVLRGYGVADLETEQSVTPDTVFRAYSIAKAFTGVEVARLANDGLIDIDDPVASMLPELSNSALGTSDPAITVRHLLGHESGLPRNSAFHPDAPVPLEDVLRLLVASMRDAELSWRPGEQRKYSNIGYNVLGRVIETARGASFAPYMTYSTLPALGMVDSAFFTGFLPNDAVIATGYARDRRRLHPVVPYDLNELASGNLFTTATDLAAAMHYLLEHPNELGMAWAVSETFARERMLWHQGGDADANAMVALFPDSSVGVALLSNTGGYEGIELLSLAVECMRIVTGRESPDVEDSPPTAVVADPPIQMATGRYVAFGELVTLSSTRSTEQDGRLVLRYGPLRLRLRPVAVTEIGTEYAISHWLGGALSRRLPIDIGRARLVITPGDALEPPPHFWLTLSDVGSERCVLYQTPASIPASWARVVGSYDGCEVVIENDALRMTGVGFLRERVPGEFVVVGGVFDGEPVAWDGRSGAIVHQGITYERVE